MGKESDISRVLLFCRCDMSRLYRMAVIYLRRLLPDASSGSKAVEPVKDQP